MAPSASQHAFRYEPELCSLAADQTLAAWRAGSATASSARHGAGPLAGLTGWWRARRA